MVRLTKYTKEARQALSYAREEAQRVRHRLVGTEHLLLGLLRMNDPFVEGLFVSLQTNSANIAQALDFVIGRGKRALLSEPAFNATARATLLRAAQEAQAAQAPQISIEHILLAIFDERDSIVVGVLESFGIYPAIARQKLQHLLQDGYEHLVASIKYQELYNATPTLNQVSRDLTIEALNGKLSPLIGREVDLERTMQILIRRSKNNPVLIGHPGVGKTAIAEGLALQIVHGNVPDDLLQCRIVALDIGLLTFGTRFRGDFEERLKAVIQEIIHTPGIIIVLDELHTLLQTGVAEGSVDAASLFKPLLARGSFRCIGATTLADYRKTIETDAALERRFQPILITESDPAATLEILYGLRSYYEHFHQVTISDEALKAAVHLSSRYIQGRHQPDSALDLIDEAAARAAVQHSLAPDTVHQLRVETSSIRRDKDCAIELHDFPRAALLLKRERQLRQELMQAEYDWHTSSQQSRPSISEQEIAQIIVARTGIPIALISQEEKLRLLNLEHELHKRVIGQPEATHIVAQAIRRARTNIRDARRPVGSFLFVGPTGVGKTELARSLAAVLFGDEHALLQLDMSEFSEFHHVSRLIGAPPGYVGYEQAGQLTEAIRRRPHSVILFDEIEKAHPKIFDLLLQILADGRLTDSHGQSVNFTETIIIITSNVGTSSLLHTPMQFSSRRPGLTNAQHYQAAAHEQARTKIMSALKDVFRPELLNRLDEIILFHSLQPEHLRQIVDLMLAQTQQRLSELSINLQVTDTARLLLAEHGYNPEYGARHLRRTIQHLLDDLLAEAILQKTIIAGDLVIVDAIDGHLTTYVQPANQHTAA